MKTQDIEQRLKSAGLRPSPNRVMILKQLATATTPISALDIEMALETVDRSSISRTLASFSSLGLVHVIEDGSGSTKYEYCHSHHDEDEHADAHPHFHCTECGETICLTDQAMPAVELPEGFTATGVNYVIKGMCDKCRKKHVQ